MADVEDGAGEWRQRLMVVYPSLRRFAAVVGSSDMSPDDLVHDAVAAALSSGGLERVQRYAHLVETADRRACRARHR